MKNVFNVVCAVVMAAACGESLADVRCWTEPSGFEECVYDKNYNAYGSLRYQVENVDFGKYYGESEEWGKLFSSSEMAKIRSAATKAGKTVNAYLADKLSKD